MIDNNVDPFLELKFPIAQKKFCKRHCSAENPGSGEVLDKNVAKPGNIPRRNSPQLFPGIICKWIMCRE
jgi:hypothetical protein